MTTRHTVRDWLLLVGAQYNIHEAHHNRRPDDDLTAERPHFLYWFDSSSDGVNSGKSLDCTTGSGNDADMLFIRQMMRKLVIACVDHSDGMDVLEDVYTSIEHPAVGDILQKGSDGHNGTDNASRLVIVNFESIGNATDHDESDTKHVYELRLDVRRHASFSLTRTNHIFDDVTITGTVENDAGDIDTLTVTDTI